MKLTDDVERSRICRLDSPDQVVMPARGLIHI
jgi:hypothetical protein